MTPNTQRRLRRLSRLALFLLLSVLALFVFAWVLVRVDPAFGARPAGARQARIERSPQWHVDRFQNPNRMWSDTNALTILGMLKKVPSQAPTAGVPYVHDTAQRLAIAPRSGLRITWFGHSWSLVEIDGIRVLIDPIASVRASPFQFLGPERWFAPPMPLSQLANVDVVLVSHDHYDHLDMASIKTLAKGPTRFVVPLGVGAHLERWGVDPARITELDWWEGAQVDAVTIHSTPARHASGRVNPQRNRTLWSGYAIAGPKHRVWYSGDTGLTDQFKEVGKRYGPFDVTMIESGQYDARWPDWHIGPEQAIQAHLWARGKYMMPVHWGLFKLARHGWTEPAERVLAAGHCANVAVITPQPGMPFEPGLDTSTRWWPDAAWVGARVTPIVASRNGSKADLYPPLACAQSTE
ncbi:hypothetical protein G7069_09250 [Lysobacter sp. HDW10]|uniref:MBL fold metallo-hydrolase n=1 Tax=Lysobacter sp. HDW10 TaxID=2714936 RepID=UPI00140AB2B4|nr:MBL fold metallo-hydrolase [Lysobacter sp. HDW10]QIK81764.1 hypothetical protein G7069_09250 [Lysobacter sp. HDW10]